MSPAAAAITAAIGVYQRALSPLLPAACRFSPTCSEYARISVVRFGAWRGAWLALWRLIRCNPLCAGGLDPVPALPPRSSS